MRHAAAAVAAVVALGCWPHPAVARSWDAQIRYWPTSVTGDYAGTIVLYNTYFWGFSLRGSPGDARWAVSVNFDRGEMTYPGLGSGQSMQTWNLNLHRNVRLPNGLLSAYVGWGSLSYQAPNFAFGPLSQLQAGLRAGVDARINLPRGFYVTGDLGYGPSGAAQFTNTFVPGSVTVEAQFLDARLAVGRTYGHWGLEVGHRWLQWNYTPGANTCPSTPCQDRWNGWYVGLNISSP
jgi:hypothetical protein